MEGQYSRLAEGIWQRLKEIVLARMRLEAFVFSPETDLKDGANRWLDSLVQDRAQAEHLAHELVLRLFQVGVEAMNYKILSHLKTERSLTLSSLAQMTGLPVLLVAERTSDLAQAGLAARNIEKDSVEATSLTDTLVELIEGGAQELSKIMRDRLPGVIER